MKFMQDLVVDILRDNKKSLSVNEITAIASDLKGKKNRSTTNYALIKLIESSVPTDKHVICQKGSLTYVRKSIPPLQHGKIADIHNRMNAMLVAVRA